MLDHISGARSESSDDLDELRRPMLDALCIASIVAAFIWGTIVATLAEAGPTRVQVVSPTVLVASAGFGLLVRGRNGPGLKAGVWIYVAGLFVATLPGILGKTAEVWFYFPSLAVLVSGLLINPRAPVAFGIGYCVILVLQHQSRAPFAPSPGSLPAVVLLWATVVVSHLASRAIYTALGWALDSQRRAWRTANEVRERREELRRAVKSLHTTHEVLERTTRELELARREAERRKQLKTEFAANISHELRTPLNIILGFTEIMSHSPEVYGDRVWPPVLRRDILEIRRNARYLSEFVDDILDLARLDALRLPINREPSDVTELVEDAVDLVRRLVLGKPVRLEAQLDDDLPYLYVDPTRIRQVLVNLLANACRFTDTGSVRVSTKADAQNVVISVSDTGAGIPPEQLERIFDEYHQAGAWKRHEESGKGLGLAIAKHLVELHGGAIRAESEPGVGSTFSFSLPLEDVRVGSLIRVEDSPLPAPEGRTHLVVLDDDELAATYLRRQLEGFEIHWAKTEVEALRLVDHWHPGAVIVNLPPDLLPSGQTPGAFLPDGVPVIGCVLPNGRWLTESGPFRRSLIKPVSATRLMALVTELAPVGDVLVVDDDRGFVQFVQRVFQTMGQEDRLFCAYDGAEALTKMRERPPALLLIDLVLPVLDGLAVAETMQSDKVLRRVPAVLVSGASFGESAISLQGAVFMVSKRKGIPASELFGLIRGVLAVSRPEYVGRDASSGQAHAGNRPSKQAS